MKFFRKYFSQFVSQGILPVYDRSDGRN